VLETFWVAWEYLNKYTSAKEKMSKDSTGSGGTKCSPALPVMVVPNPGTLKAENADMKVS
jgi:hypothetical protein